MEREEQLLLIEQMITTMQPTIKQAKIEGRITVPINGTDEQIIEAYAWVEKLYKNEHIAILQITKYQTTDYWERLLKFNSNLPEIKQLRKAHIIFRKRISEGQRPTILRVKR